MVAPEWRAVVGAPGYEVSEDGQVRSWRPWGSRNTKPPVVARMLKQRTDKDGYKRVVLMIAGKETGRAVHRLVAEAWHGAPTPGAVTRHLDGSKDNNHFSNLEWGSTAENVADAIRHGTMVRGTRAHKAKLTDESARTIFLDKRPNAEVAKAYGVTPGAVWFIKMRRSWVHACEGLY